jgi:hypothetical protein
VSKAIKQLSEAFPRYDITSDITGTGNPELPFGSKVVITIMGEGNSFSKRVNADSSGFATVEEAEADALQKAVDRLLGKGPTKTLQNYPFFDLSVVPMSTGSKLTPVGMKASVSIFGEDNKIIRRVQAVSTGTDFAEVEKNVIKSAISKLGV